MNRLLSRMQITAFGLLCLAGSAHAQTLNSAHSFSRSYPAAYEDWPQAFLAGNGKTGIMVFGNPLSETVIFNDRGFNLAGSAPRSFAEVDKDVLLKIRHLCAMEKFKEANDLAVSSAQYHNGGEGSRHPGYVMSIDIPPQGDVRDYERSCDFSTGEIAVKWTDDRGCWLRRSFVSRPDHVVVQSLTAPSDGLINCSIRLAVTKEMGMPDSLVVNTAADASGLNIRVKYRAEGGAGYEGVTRYLVAGGTHRIEGNRLIVEGAREVLLLTRIDKYSENCEQAWQRGDIQKALAGISMDYAELLERQTAVHGEIFKRISIDLGASPQDRLLSNEALLEKQRQSSQPVPALWERLFYSGRYHFLSSSSELTPPDLLGIWTGNARAGWGGFYHLDANLNLQIGGGNIGDMPEAMEGYFHINEVWSKDFETNARKLLGCRGMVAGGNTPGLSSGLMASISEYYPYQYATGEEPWLLYPFWEHYLVTGDREFLQNRLYPLLKEMGHFYEDFLTETDVNGNYILAGSVSPENQPSNLKVSLLNNSTFDLSGARFALDALVQTCRILGVEQGPGGALTRWQALLDKLPPYLVNEEGALKEWAWPGLEESYGHRHWSQCLTVWPYREINAEDTPELFKAATVTLDKKNAHDVGSGHGVLHGALVAAGLNDARTVQSRLLKLSREDYYYDSLFSSHDPQHKTYCADTCHTFPTILMEMLISSRPGVVELLPALPCALKTGRIDGVKARTRLTIESLAWNMENRRVDCVLRSLVDQEITLIERSGIDEITTTAEVRSSPLGETARILKLPKDRSVLVSLRLGELRAAQENIAENKPAAASSDDGTHPAQAAVDGNTGTRWASENRDNQWLQVDLGSVQKVGTVRICWEKASGRDYDIEVSEDGKWLAVKSVRDNTADGWLYYPNLNARGRYVRILCMTRTTQYGFSIKELEVYPGGSVSR